MKDAFSISIGELVQQGLESLPRELISNAHLIYSSPATLAFNSPGAEGFGVKRAGLTIPGSIMLIVAPGCCGRNTALVSKMPEYSDRFFYLNMDETDVVTGRHLKKIPKAVAEVVDFCETRPTVVMLCITCVDALLGTDLERVCRRCEEEVGLPVRPCYMYALTREGRRPPMVHVRQSLYSLLKPMNKKSTSVNILGYFAPVQEDCELFYLLKQIGIKTIRQLSTCENYTEYLSMAEANFNLVLNPEARFAARDLEERLHIPSIELTRLYQTDRIHRQYQALGNALGVALDDSKPREMAEAQVAKFTQKHPDLTFAIGECLNGDCFELAVTLLRLGFHVSEIYGTITAENQIWVKHIAKLSPETRLLSNLEPTMLYYDSSTAHADMTLGRDAGYYHPNCPNLPWNSDRQPFGYAGVWHLFRELEKLLENGEENE